MGKTKQYDFSGWATKNDLRCADGLTIRSGAFRSNNGKRVPLVWNHVHNTPATVIGHADLSEKPEGSGFQLHCVQGRADQSGNPVCAGYI